MIKPTVIAKLGITSIFFLGLAVVSIILFHADVYFPISVSVALMALVVVYFVRQLKTKRIGALMAILLLVYLLPFIHIPPYLWFDFNSDPFRLWGLAVRPYMLDERIIRLTAMLGATGALGMAFAVSFMRGRLVRDTGLKADGSRRMFRSLATPIWLVWVLIGVGLSWISAPQETIFTSRYTMSASIHAGMNFSSAWMMSYVILTFAFIDALLDRNPIRRAVKWKIALATVAFVVIWFQLLRGDRAAVPWVFALAVVYFYWASAFKQRNKNIKVPWFKLAAWVFMLVFVSMIIGGVRHRLTGTDLSTALAIITSMFAEGSLGLSNILHGTWSAVLLTPLSVAGDHTNNLLAMKWGQDYVNIFLSLPPGFVADAAGYVRPLNATTGPAWEMRYGLGGTHASVVPFMNFRMAGVFFIPALWSYIFLRYERYAIHHVSVVKLSLLATITLSSAHFMWYGEKNVINAIILWFIFSFFYRVSLALSRKAGLGHIPTGMESNANG